MTLHLNGQDISNGLDVSPDDGADIEPVAIALYEAFAKAFSKGKGKYRWLALPEFDRECWCIAAEAAIDRYEELP